MWIRQSYGQRIEDMLILHFEQVFGRDFRVSTQVEDRLYGADGYLYGVPVDFTTAFDKKDHTFFLGQVDVLGVYSIAVGARWRNRHEVFPQPVIVFGISFSFKGRYGLQHTLVKLIDKASVESAFDLYWEWVDKYENKELDL
ncbi:hypothetical protein [Alicyclobacillus shizuokensis]|uniref:hypothetical protein n=1 Tax=Alicyclobacillus shizuokensis TaxID=392014 RepID=UPI0008327765|nr:hypothetical protein [Alicyclobacillus shizuokensis]